MNTDEQKVLDEIKAAQARGDDPFGDDDTDEVLENEVTSEESTDDDAPADKAAAPVAGQTDEPEAPVVQAQYKAELPVEHKAQRAELLKSKAEAMKKLMDGEIGAEEFAAEESRISDALEDLTAQRIRAETLIEANQQMAAQTQQKALQRLIAQSKQQIDYMADMKAQKQFDVALQTIGADPDNASMDYAELLQEAHKVVCAIRGVPLSKGEQVAQAVQASRRPTEQVPMTLRNIPAASTANANGDMLEQMGRLTGQAYQDAFAKLSPAQRRSLLDEAE